MLTLPHFSLFSCHSAAEMGETPQGGHATGSRLFCTCIPASQGTDAGSGGCSGEGEHWETLPWPPRELGTWHRSRVAQDLQVSVPFCPEERRGGQLEEQRLICCVSYLGARRPRQEKLSGVRTSADPELAEVCGETSVGFRPGPGRGMSNARPKHGAEDRDIVGGEGEGCRAKRERGRHFKCRLVRPIPPPLQSRLFSRGRRRDGSRGETSRGKGLFFSLRPSERSPP